jgi:3-hexulose-6-phosphate synthase
MKLQVSFDIIDLDHSIAIAGQIAEFVDIFEVGTLPIYKYGVKAIETFHTHFPQKKILADAKIADRGRDATALFVNAGANWITVMAGTGKMVIHDACTAAHSFNANVLLDLLDAPSIGHSAMEAKDLGVDALLFHQPHDEKDTATIFEKWEMVKGNSDLPVHISAKIGRSNIHEIIQLKPDVIVVGSAIIMADNPALEAKYFADLIKGN